MQQIGQLINAFAAGHTDKVEAALTGFGSESQSALLEVGAASQLVHNSAAASKQKLKVA